MLLLFFFLPMVPVGRVQQYIYINNLERFFTILLSLRSLKSINCRFTYIALRYYSSNTVLYIFNILNQAFSLSLSLTHTHTHTHTHWTWWGAGATKGRGSSNDTRRIGRIKISEQSVNIRPDNFLHFYPFFEVVIWPISPDI